MVALLKAVPSLVSPNIDTSKIILVGHSFGGSAVTIAAAQGAEIAGLVLLDPAVVSEEIYSYQKSVQVPVVLLGADKTVFKSRYRDTFSKNIKSPFFEISIVGAEHTDAHLVDRSTFWGLISEEDRNQRRDIFKKLILESTLSILEDDFSVLSKKIRETSRTSQVQIRIDHWQR
jgi:pimeloyl-ACP methyl ester carboxylesterase